MAETSVPSHLTAARPSILRSKSTSDISTNSGDSKGSNITFAPLPCIEARKRRSNRPIGLASRAEMLRKTQQQFSHLDDEPHTPPEDDEIPLPDFGKLVKGLWRSVSRGKGRNSREGCCGTTTVTEGINTSASDEHDGEGGVWIEEVAWSPSSAAKEEDELIRRDAVENDGTREVELKQQLFEREPEDR